MPKGDKYVGLRDYLKLKKETQIILTYSKIEELIDGTLPPSAYKHRAFWSNTETHSVAYGWLDTKYKTVDVDFDRKQVIFKRE